MNAQAFYTLITNPAVSQDYPEIASFSLSQSDPDDCEDFIDMTVHQAASVGDEYYVIQRSGQMHDDEVSIYYSKDEALDAAYETLEGWREHFDQVKVDGELNDYIMSDWHENAEYGISPDGQYAKIWIDGECTLFELERTPDGQPCLEHPQKGWLYWNPLDDEFQEYEAIPMAALSFLRHKDDVMGQEA